MAKVLPEDFKVNGASPVQLGHTVIDLKMVEIFDALPDNELVDTREVAIRISCNIRTVRERALSSAFAKYRYKHHSQKVYWGNPKTIVELKIRMAEEG